MWKYKERRTLEPLNKSTPKVPKVTTRKDKVEKVQQGKVFPTKASNPKAPCLAKQSANWLANLGFLEKE